jgi:hypothetical protein
LRIATDPPDCASPTPPPSSAALPTIVQLTICVPALLPARPTPPPVPWATLPLIRQLWMTGAVDEPLMPMPPPTIAALPTIDEQRIVGEAPFHTRMPPPRTGDGPPFALPRVTTNPSRIVDGPIRSLAKSTT